MKNTTSIQKQAVHLLPTETKEQKSQKSSLQLFEESGLLGCIEGAPDLSTTYKEKIQFSKQ